MQRKAMKPNRTTKPAGRKGAISDMDRQRQASSKMRDVMMKITPRTLGAIKRSPAGQIPAAFKRFSR